MNSAWEQLGLAAAARGGRGAGGGNGFHTVLPAPGPLHIHQWLPTDTERPRLSRYSLGVDTTPSDAQTHRPTLTLAHETQTLLCAIPTDARKASFAHSYTGAHRHTQPHSDILHTDSKPNQTSPFAHTQVYTEATTLQVHSLPRRPSCSGKTHLAPFTHRC